MAQQAMAEKRDSAPAIHVGAPNDGIMERFNELARRAYSIFESHGRALGNDLSNWFQAERELFRPALIEVSESDSALTVRAEVPGFEPGDLDINLEGRRLTISGKREKHEERKEKKTIYSESRSDQILRVVDLPADVKADDAKATLKDGILELELPKAAPAKKISVSPRAA
jgi:HSP20 family protein